MKKDPVKYRKLVNQFRIEWVEKSKNTPIQIVDSAQNFSLWLDKKGYFIGKKWCIKLALREIHNLIKKLKTQQRSV